MPPPTAASDALLPMLIERPPVLFRKLVPGGIFRVPAAARGGRKEVYLTFDDGPIPEVTPWVLDQLDAYGIKATFFMVGDNARKYPDVAREVLQRGHAVGNHTMHHVQGAGMTTRSYLRDVQEAAELLDTSLFRPPHGWLRPAQARALRSRYTLVMYDLVTRDYSYRLDADRVFANVRRYARPGAIIVFHDSLKSRDRILTALPRSLEWLLEQGYTFGLLTDLKH